MLSAVGGTDDGITSGAEPEVTAMRGGNGLAY
jgi:hypothetical protein